jgi:peroxiredoxin
MVQRATQSNQRSSRPTVRSLGLFLVGVGLLLLGIVASLTLPPLHSATSSGEEKPLAPARLNNPAPQLTLTDLEGKTVSLADYAGYVILVNNWATWCPPCRDEMPILQAYYQDYQAKGFVLIGIEAGDSVAEVSAFVQQYRLTFPIWLDEQNQALHAFANYALPNSYLIDRQGMVVMGWTGALSRHALETYITPLLEE